MNIGNGKITVEYMLNYYVTLSVCVYG